MKVRTISNKGTSLPDLYLDPAAGYTAGTIFPLQVDKEYVVYALTLRQGGVWYYLLDETGVEYPVWFPAPLFEIMDARLSRYWTFGFSDRGLRDGSAIFSFAEWARNPLDYYDRLTDGEARATSTFSQYRELLALEFRDSSADGVAEELEDGWLLCPHCREAWQATLRGEMIRCPFCKRVLQNPALVSAD